MRKNYNEFRNVWFSWEDKISITLFGFPILLVRKYEWLEKERSNWAGSGNGHCPAPFDHKEAQTIIRRCPL